jgi:hypothetical protein
VEDLNPAFLGIKALNKFAYLSTESVLVQHGIITQISNQITLISSISKKYKIKNNLYKVRQLSDKFLFNEVGITLVERYYQATPERAVADLLYFNPNFHFDGEKLIDWKKVKEIQKELGREFVKLKA